jgi:hypothetical protein
VSSTEFAVKFAQIDAATRARLEAGCNFVNHKIAQLRSRVLLICAVAVAGALVWWQAADIDVRFPLGGAAAVIVLTSAWAKRELARWYKKMVIHRVVEALGHGLTYQAGSHLARDQFRAIDLYQGRIDNWKSEDEINGARNDVSFALHEVRATRQEKRGKHTHTVVVFSGIVAVLEFNKHFHGHTVVVPDREGKVLGGLFGEADTRRGKNVVHVADADFENTYAVYSTDDQQAHYLLTPKLIQLILKARTHFGDIRLAFYQNSLFVTLPSTRNRFEAGLFTRVTPESALQELADVVALAEQLIDVLELELRIWTRE